MVLMDTVPRLRITRHSQLPLSPLDHDSSRTPTAGPSRLHALHGDNEDTDSTPRLPVSSSLPSIYAPVEDTPAARLRALLAHVPNTSSASRTQLLHEPPPPLPSDRDSDFDPPPKWANSSTTSSARENLRSLFTYALRDPGDTPRKDARRNSIDSSEVEDSPRIDRVIQERSRNKGKRTSFSDEELETSSKRNTPIPASHAANMEALKSRILGTHLSQPDASMSVASDSSTDNAALIREMHGRAAPAPGISSASLQPPAHLSTQFQSQSNLLDQDSEMQRAMGVADSFGSASVERPSKFANGIVGPPVAASDASSVVGTVPNVPSTPPRERRDSYHHHRASHSLTGSPLPQEFPRQRNSPAQSGSSRSSSRTGSTSSLADFRDRMKDTEKERQHERERAWNMPLSARSRTTSNTSTTGHPARPGLDQPRFTPDRVVRSREHSRQSSPSESDRSRTAEEKVDGNSEREPNPASPHTTRVHQPQHRRPASHIPVRSPGRVLKIEMKPNGGVKKFTKGHKRATTEFAEANGAIPPRISDALTPIARPIELPPPEKLHSPSPPEDLPLPELPGPPSEDDTGDNLFATCENGGLPNLNLTIAKTPRPPGAWAATPAPAPARSQTPQPTLSSIGHPRTRSNSLPQPSFTEIRSSLATPTPALTHAGTLPARTPAPPGGWFSTPGSLRRRSLMKVRFETTPSGSAVSDVDATAKDDKEVEASLPEANWDVTPPLGPTHGTSESMSEPSFNNVESSSPIPALSTSASGDDQKESDLVANFVNGTAVGSPSRRKLRRTPSVRLVDEYGRAKEDFPSTPSRKDVREHSASMRMPGGGALKTPRNASVRILDAMGHELEEPSEQNDSEDTVTETRYTRQEALERMKKAVADLREGLNSVDTPGNGSLDDPRLGELYDLSKAARDMRSKLASSLQQAQTTQIRHKYGSLKESMRKSRFLPDFLPEPRVISWNRGLFWGIFSLQFIVFLVMYRMSKMYARHQFLTTYFDPFYADLHLHPTKPEYIYDTNLFSFLRRASMDPSLLERLGVDGPVYQFKRGIADLVAQVQRCIWESWGVSVNDQVMTWPPK
ncbi:hypothetical protein H4582DRAFT_594749 [Lactarius indigo]|nr:hypothetical protein H4582DRAFT_594749 [Lactarius indigo]